MDIDRSLPLVPSLGVIVCMLLMAGCAAIERRTEGGAEQVATVLDARVSAAPPSGLMTPAEPALSAPAGSSDAAAAEPPRSAAAEPPQAALAARAAVTAEPLVVNATAPASAAGRRAASPPAVATPAAPKPAGRPAPAAPEQAKDALALAPVHPDAAPPLDLKSLEARLKNTKAIGVFTKLALKNQVDDLLGQFRAFYRGALKVSLADLRQSYDRLVLKVLALLQDGDAVLAQAIAASRESIWGILSNPAKFAAV